MNRLGWLGIGILLMLAWISICPTSTPLTLSPSVQAQAENAPSIETVTPDAVRISDSREITIKGRNFSPDSTLTIEGAIIKDVDFISAGEIRLRVPVDAVPGVRTLSILSNNGIAQHAVNIISKSASELAVGQVTTIAGGTTFFGDGGLGVNASILSPSKIALDASGNLFVVDQNAGRVRRIDAQTNIVTTVVGGGSSLENGAVATTALISPTSIAVDRNGNLFVGDAFTAAVRRVDGRTRVITTIAGGAQGPKAPFSGDGGLAVSASLGDEPKDVVLDATGNLLIAANNRVRRVDAQTGIITTVAGNGQLDFSGDGGPATSAAIGLITGLTLDNQGNLFIVMAGRVRRVEAATGIITTVAGNGSIDLDFDSRDGQPATSVSISTDYNADAVVDASGNLFIVEFFFGRILRVDAQTKLISTVRPQPLPIDNLCAELLFNGGLALDNANRLYVAEITGQVRRVDLATNASTRLIGGNKINLRGDNNGDGDLAAKASLGKLQQTVTDRRGNIYLSDIANGYIRKIDAQTGLISTVAGNGVKLCDETDRVGKPAIQTAIQPFYLAVDRNSNLYFSNGRQVFRIDAASKIVSLAAGTPLQYDENGDEIEEMSGDNGPATQASLGYVTGLALNDNGDLFISCINFFSDGKVRRVDAQTGIITTVAGNGKSFSGDGGPALQAGMIPLDITFDGQGNLLLADASIDAGFRVRKIDAATGVINTVAGKGGFDFSGENGPATQAGIGFVQSLTTDAAGNIFIGAVGFADDTTLPGPPRGRPRVWRVDAQNQRISVVIDSQQGAYSGDGGASSAASLIGYRNDGHIDVETDVAGNLLIVNRDDGSVAALRFIRLTNGDNVGNPLEINKVSFTKPNLTIVGKNFGSSARVKINDRDVSALLTSQSDTNLMLKGNRQKLNLRKGFNRLTITNSQGATATFSF